MAEDQNMMLRLLRDIRADQQRDSARLTRVERKIDELNEGAVTAMGMAAHANILAERGGEQFDELRDEIATLKMRVQELETR